MELLDIIDSHDQKDKVAHQYRESKLTFRDLKERSDAMAVFLIKSLGFSKTPIIVYGHKQHEMLVCFLACAKSGHPYIPIDSSIPTERIKDIVNSSEAEIILNIDSSNCFFKNCTVLDLAQINYWINKYVGIIPDKKYRVVKEDTYYVIYTSGSTGEPKGVQITLACLESFLIWALFLCKSVLTTQSVFLNQAPFSFDLSVMDLYLSLVTGSTLFSVDKQMAANLKELFDYLHTSNINVWVSTPSFAEICLADRSFSEKLMHGVKLFLFCGEVLTQSCAGRLYKRFNKARIINMYGPTEATVAVTAIEINKKMYSGDEPLPVGYVKKDCNILIIDSNGNELPQGNKGEILIAGDSVGTGYLKDSKLTEKVFSEVLINDIRKRCYRTGDEGFLKDNLLYYCGRIDSQIKLNGYRIELEDIENNLRKVSFVKNAVIVPINKNGRIQYLSAIVVLDKVLDEREFKIGLMIKGELKNYLPEYMIPRKIIVRKNLPVTANGKVNRKLLIEQIKESQ